jgi:hypothetical protein
MNHGFTYSPPTVYGRLGIMIYVKDTDDWVTYIEVFNLVVWIVFILGALLIGILVWLYE